MALAEAGSVPAHTHCYFIREALSRGIVIVHPLPQTHPDEIEKGTCNSDLFNCSGFHQRNCFIHTKFHPEPTPAVIDVFITVEHVLGAKH